MLDRLEKLLAPALTARLTLLANHVIGSEEAATARLRPHAGRTVVLQMTGLPSLLRMLPAAAPLAWRVTPAGLLEWCGDIAEVELTRPDLLLQVTADNPALLVARAFGGERPQVQIEGDAQFAADVSWLLAHLRWDFAGDVQRFVGPVAAGQLARLGTAVAAALRAAVQGAGRVGDKMRGRAQGFRGDAAGGGGGASAPPP